MTVDVVIVNWNGGPEVLDAIASAVRFGASVIVVDNASTTGVSADLGSRTDIRLIRNPVNGGFAVACNLGAAAGSGDIVFLLNPDAEIVKGSAADLERAFATTGATLIGAPMEQPSGQRVATGRELPRISQLLADLLRVNAIWGRICVRTDPLVAKPAWIIGAALALRRADWDRLGGLDERFFLWYEDVDLGARVAESGGSVAVADALRVRHIGASTWTRLPRRRRQWLRVRAVRLYAGKHLGRTAELSTIVVAPFALAIGVGLDIVHWLARR
ncbi:MAG: glycosyltransferase family 2 protein [Chloroflexota bacterium]